MAIEKPVVFFSHSGKDKAALKKLKERFVELTGGTIDVFLSSDGQSIRLGSNWVASIENALNATTIMFVFVSPSSLNTPWLYFETGHAYGKAKDVVPVGLFGVDIGKLSPPINLLQGFNLVDAESMNNLITKVNEVFKTTHKLAFTSDDFAVLKSQGGYQGAATVLGEHASSIEKIILNVVVSEEERFAIWERFESLPSCVKGRSADLNFPGAAITLQKQLSSTVREPGKMAKLDRNAPPSYSISVDVDPFAAASIMPIVEGVFEQALSREADYRVGCRFLPFVDIVLGAYRQMARLQDVRFADDWFHGDAGRFTVATQYVSERRPVASSLVVSRPRCTPFSGDDKLGKLIDLVFERGVLFYDEASYE